MSNGEVKRFSLVTDIVGGDEWTGLRRHAEGYYMSYADHDRIVAEKDAEIERLKSRNKKECPRCEFWDRLPSDTLKDEQTIATQKRVIEKLKLAITDIANKNTCWRLYEIDKYKSYEDGWEGVAEFAGKVLNELAAIEKGEK